ncbi:MAG: hypothetical protein C5B50_18655 [Verrucomicrobia bacterium]|nr:MAG: hypothetical protein C5B50_18655 [Verrucomicrobiota bacterium]
MNILLGNHITQRGKIVAHLAPDSGFINGKNAAALFADHLRDPETADAINGELAELKSEDDDALPHSD